AADNDGKAYVRSGNTSSGAIIDSIDLSDLSFNGVLLGTGRVNVEGKLDGRLSVASQTNVWIQNDIRYERDPQAGLSNDLLGLIAEKNVIIADNAANNSNCEIHASVFCRDGSFYAENYNTRAVSGELRVLGSVVQNERGAVGTFSGSTLKSGFSKRYRYDDRLSNESVRPPCYPGFTRQQRRNTAKAPWEEGSRREVRAGEGSPARFDESGSCRGTGAIELTTFTFLPN
ncbi:MAG: hypothetical protein H6Q31_1251, partial [Bacteroidetes bacterium]|nr:hypothetical protein [Bacteroidota bacterium]